MIFILTIDTDNEAFAGDGGVVTEVARCLRAVATGVEDDPDLRAERPVFDINGNQVGTFLLAGHRPFDWETDQ